LWKLGAFLEHRVGLKPVNRIIWVQKGEQPIANVNWKFEWLWLVGFVHPNSGNTYWWIVPFLNTEVFSRLLENFALHFEVGRHKRIVLAIDPRPTSNAFEVACGG
jgi:hypothetical protein